MDTWNNVPKLKAHCTLIIKVIIFVQCSVVLFPRRLHSRSRNIWWQDTCTWQGIGGRVPRVLIEVGLSCVWHLLPLGSISTPRVLQSILQELPRYSNSKASAGVVGGLLHFSHRGLWGLGLSADTRLAPHLQSFMLLSCWKGSFPVLSFMVSHGLHLLRSVQQIFSQLCWVLYWTCLHVVYNELFETICFLNWIVEKLDTNMLRLST